MNFKSLHENFVLPGRGTPGSAGLDLVMPTGGELLFGQAEAKQFKLGFAVEIPPNHVGLLAPRSGKGANFGVEVNNTLGFIDSDYRDEVIAFLRLKNTAPLRWCEGDKLLQLIVVPVAMVTPQLVADLSPKTDRIGGFGSTDRPFTPQN